MTTTEREFYFHFKCCLNKYTILGMNDEKIKGKIKVETYSTLKSLSQLWMLRDQTGIVA